MNNETETPAKNKTVRHWTLTSVGLCRQDFYTQKSFISQYQWYLQQNSKPSQLKLETQPEAKPQMWVGWNSEACEDQSLSAVAADEKAEIFFLPWNIVMLSWGRITEPEKTIRQKINNNISSSSSCYCSSWNWHSRVSPAVSCFIKIIWNVPVLKTQEKPGCYWSTWLREVP